VTLSGAVPSHIDRVWAEAAAKRVKSVTAVVPGRPSQTDGLERLGHARRRR
jgi:hypothetical protein